MKVGVECSISAPYNETVNVLHRSHIPASVNMLRLLWLSRTNASEQEALGGSSKP